MQKILILYTSVGLGHKSMAENIGYHLEHAGFKVKLADVLQVQAGSTVNFGTKVHRFINTKMPWLWSWMYKSKLFSDLTLPLRVRVASRNFHETKKLIEQFQPDLVITAQTSASAILEYLKIKNYYQGLWAITFSDFHLHRYWLYDRADFYLVNIEEQKQTMLQLGIPAEKIFVCGMNLQPRVQADQAVIKARLNIPVHHKVLMIGAGSLGIGLPDDLIDYLAAQVQHFSVATTLLVTCGKNQELFERLVQRYQQHQHTQIINFHSNLRELFAITDVYITKPGGLSVSEALQWQIPIVVTHWLPGQEELNYWYLQKHGLIMPLSVKPDQLEPSVVWKTIAKELLSSEFKKSLAANATVVALVGTPGGDSRVVQAVKQMFHAG
jgi:processive 1,2-diacylglycerol beta-glucosyltransferase